MAKKATRGFSIESTKAADFVNGAPSTAPVKTSAGDNDLSRLSVNVPTPLYKAFKKLAAELDTTISELVIDDMVKRLEAASKG